MLLIRVTVVIIAESINRVNCQILVIFIIDPLQNS